MERLKEVVSDHSARRSYFRHFADSIGIDDYNSWQETSKSEEFKDQLDTEVIVVEGSQASRSSPFLLSTPIL